MDSRNTGMLWIPLWVDKWLFGSTTFELSLAEQAVFLRLMCLAAKDDGYIRANPTTPYPSKVLAGLISVPLRLLKSTLEKSIKVDKIEVYENDTMRFKKWAKFQLTDRRKRDLQPISAKTEIPSAKTDTILDESRVDEIRLDESRADGVCAIQDKEQNASPPERFFDGPPPIFVLSPFVVLTDELLACIRSCVIKKMPFLEGARLQKWRGDTERDIERLFRIDGISVDDIHAAIEFCKADKPKDGWGGWGSVILSGRNLREKYSKIAAQMSRRSASGRPKGALDRDSSEFDDVYDNKPGGIADGGPTSL